MYVDPGMFYAWRLSIHVWVEGGGGLASLLWGSPGLGMGGCMWYIRGEGCLELPLLLGNLFATFAGLQEGLMELVVGSRGIYGKRMRNVMCSMRG